MDYIYDRPVFYYGQVINNNSILIFIINQNLSIIKLNLHYLSPVMIELKSFDQTIFFEPLRSSGLRQLNVN